MICFSSIGIVKAQDYGDPSYYLIDSLDISIINKTDSILLDSCLTVYHKEKTDTSRINAIKHIIEESWDKNIWPAYNEWLYKDIQKKLALKSSPEVTLFYKRTYASAVNNKGYLFSSEGDAHQALIYYKESLKIQESIGDQEGAATSLNNIGAIYNKVGDIPNALEYYHKSVEIYAKINNVIGQGQALNNLGHIHHSQGNNELALEYFEKSLELFKKENHKKGEATLLNSIGYFYYKSEDHDLALKYYKEALAIRQKINDLNGMASSLNNIASAFSGKSELDSARKYYLASVPYYESQNNKSGLAITYSNLAGNCYALNKQNEALSYAQMSFDLAEELKSPDILAISANAYSKILEGIGDKGKALDMLHLYIDMRDSTHNQESKIAAAKSESKYEYLIQKAIQEKEHEKEIELNDIKHEKEIVLEQKAKENQKILSLSIGVILILTAIFLVIVFLRLKVTRKQKSIIELQKSVVENAHTELEEKNKEIIDSINYAKRIQMAILPPQKMITETLPNSFILYKPKDVVAGDFYWLENKNNETLLAACDCTGHGVPGAMVSVICNNGLNRSVREYGLTIPGEILDKTREIVVQEFEKSENEVKDGMDVAIVSLRKNEDGTAVLQYAGANNPLWIVRDTSKLGELDYSEISDSVIECDNYKLYEIKPNHQPIGQFEDPKPYSTHQIELKKGDLFYIFSDGYSDQFGGEKGKKLKTINFKKLLLSIQSSSIKEQSVLLENAFEKWKGDFEQLDDICIIGNQI